MLYITGDTHGDFYRFCHLGLNDGDIMIILGDVGINYYLNEYDKKLINISIRLIIREKYGI